MLLVLPLMFVMMKMIILMLVQMIITEVFWIVTGNIIEYLNDNVVYVFKKSWKNCYKVQNQQVLWDDGQKWCPNIR